MTDPARFEPVDHAHMRRAVALARRGQGPASPNPSVGCVVADRERVVGEGWTQAFGGAHAERIALEAAGGEARGATLYVTLAPCAHHGKTPPCTDAILEAGIARAVIALEDPDPVSLDGAAILRDGGVAVETGLGAAEALAGLAGFLKHQALGRPLVRYKYAMSLDGRIATRTGDSRWISAEAARAEVQAMRAESDAILVGAQTARADNPRLNVRLARDAIEEPAPAWQPRRVVVDARCAVSPAARLFREAGGPVVILTTSTASREKRQALGEAGAKVLVCEQAGTGDAPRVDLKAGLHGLAELGVRTCLCEGGGELAAGLLEAGLLDEIVAYVAPVLIGGRAAVGPLGGEGIARMAEAMRLDGFTAEPVGADVRLTARVGDWSWAEALLEGAVPLAPEAPEGADDA